MSKTREPQSTKTKDRDCFLNMHRSCREACSAYYEDRCLVLAALNVIAASGDRMADVASELTQIAPPRVR